MDGGALSLITPVLITAELDGETGGVGAIVGVAMLEFVKAAEDDDSEAGGLLVLPASVLLSTTVDEAFEGKDDSGGVDAVTTML